jgi:hypothetical protein
MKISATTTCCIGRNSIRTGTSCARSVIQPDYGRTTTPSATATQRRGLKSALAARPVMGKGPITSLGLARNRAGGHSAGKRIAAKACSLAWMSAQGSYGRKIRPAETFGAIFQSIFYGRKLKPAAAATRAAASCPRNGRRGTGFRKRTRLLRRSQEMSTGLTAKCGTSPRPITTSRSSRARCLQQG